MKNRFITQCLVASAMLAGAQVAMAKPIIVTAPQQFTSTFVAAMNSGNLDGLLSLYANDALVVTDGIPLHGTEKIRENLVQFKSLGGVLESRDLYVLQHDDIALLRAHWRILDRKERQKVLAEGESNEVLKRQPDGRWVYLIDHPYGATANAEQAALKQ
ncbi:DUF4440 domain-containing protein [Paraburkholderia bonniea]|uniref:YybH family protein n=1 Tax=Paraburkholderia bonniea TaxID=2152891 RepID=UPI00157FF41A|nr:DUF4440 domain-containing protein [Paraburkholderia bonniea]WJF89473.1 DUF4440 domain-containing protein [Paraburkholderia bonniea]WJF92788.1 DUF4440 domain-containing protein [Paraburkholderia bonniea]